MRGCISWPKSPCAEHLLVDALPALIRRAARGVADMQPMVGARSCHDRGGARLAACLAPDWRVIVLTLELGIVVAAGD
jgi:hypothetical protein